MLMECCKCGRSSWSLSGLLVLGAALILVTTARAERVAVVRERGSDAIKMSENRERYARIMDRQTDDAEGEVAGGSNCCAAHPTPGCDNPSCQGAVCACDPFCCNVTWDDCCATNGSGPGCVPGCGAQAVCGDLCQGGGSPCDGAAGDCCTANGSPGCNDPECCETICGCDPFCCATTWDMFCATTGFGGSGCGAALLCEQCGGGGGNSNCCFANGTPGCDDPTCQAAVCGCDPFCCNVTWDMCCATNGGGAGCVPGCGAQVVCPDLCQGGGSGCDGATGDCCSANGSPGCNDPECCSTVCACDPFCCDTEWDDFCAGTGFEPGCGAALLCEQCGGGGGSNCCFANGTPGCDDPTCQAAVCACDPFCCNVTWDNCCATNGGGAGCVPGCGAEIVCPGLCGGGPTSNCCFANGTPGCDDPTCQAAVCACDAFCCNVTWDDCCATNGGGAGCVPGCGAEVVCGALCTGGGGPPNDQCANAIPIGNGTVSYSNVGATTDGPALPTTCEKGFGLSLGADIWYDYTPPMTGMATVDLCLGTDYDARIAVYTGCTCPALTANTIGCDDDGCCPGDAGCASSMSFSVTMGQCYKLRIGGFGTSTGPGEFVISTAGTANCPAGTVTFTNPLNGTVDARQPNPVNSLMPRQGIQTITATGPAGADPSCWRMCETASSGGANSIQSVTGSGTYTITLARPITPGAVTRISYTPNGGLATVGTFVAHPANVNGDNVSGPVDILRIIDCLNGVNLPVNCPWGVYSMDIDHSTVFNPADILRVIDLLNGADVFDVWNNTMLPNAPCTP